MTQEFVYDFKIIEFPNCTCEIRIYDVPISKLDEKENRKRQEKRQRTIKKRLEDDVVPCAVVYVPFEGEECEVVDMDLQEEKNLVNEMRKRKNARDSHRRTLNKIHDLARCEEWSMFYTLTFSEDVVDRQDFGACMKKIRKWFNNLQQRKAPNLKYLIVPELHSDGCSWHVHGLVCCDGGVTYVDSGKRDKHGRIIYNIEDYKYGWSTATEVTDTKKVSSYILKYITKELCELSLGQRRYYRSNNLREPNVLTLLSSEVFEEGYVHNLDNLETMLVSLGYENVSRIKKVVSDYCSVTYINAD